MVLKAVLGCSEKVEGAQSNAGMLRAGWACNGRGWGCSGQVERAQSNAGMPRAG